MENNMNKIVCICIFEKARPTKLIKSSDTVQHVTIYIWQYVQVVWCSYYIGMSIMTLLLWTCLFLCVFSYITIMSMLCLL